MATWYRVRPRWPDITPVEIERETALSIYIKGSRNAKRTSWASYFPTWEEAHSFLLAEVEKEMNSARLQLQRAQGKHGNVKGMKKPEVMA